jgi:RNA polymerase sigma-70 factor (ECF subfamily)
LPDRQATAPIIEPLAETPDDLASGVSAQPLLKIGLTSSPSARRKTSISFAGDYHTWVEALVRGDEGAAVAFFHEYVSLVERTIVRILGADADLADATQDVFVRALQSIHRLRDPQAMTEWLLQIAVCTAADWVRRRQRRRWLSFRDPAEMVNSPASTVDASDREALRATYAILDKLNVEERSAFALRVIDGMELREVALACGCSLATIKRRLTRAEARFEKLARLHPCLLPWISNSEREEKPCD